MFDVILQSDGCLYWIDARSLTEIDALYDRFPTSMEPLAVTVRR